MEAGEENQEEFITVLGLGGMLAPWCGVFVIEEQFLKHKVFCALIPFVEGRTARDCLMGY